MINSHLSTFTPFRSSCNGHLSRATTVPGRCSERLMARAVFEGCQTQLAERIKVVGCGSCGVDYLASIAAYPSPDQKLRTDALEVQGGGNCANALTAAARLGLSPVIVTKIGGDGLGDGILSELSADGVETGLVLRAAGHPSPFTYIIVDRQGGTRTCIHTPGAPMLPDEMTPELMSAALDGADLAYFDGRLTEAALRLAAAARERGVPVLVEGERLRPGLQDLLATADVVVTSAHFPQEWTGEQCIGDAMLEMAARLPKAHTIITTRGSKGSICLTRVQGQEAADSSCLQDVIDDFTSRLQQEIQHNSSSNGNGNGNGNRSAAGAVCVSSNGVYIQPARVASTPAAVRLKFTAGRDGNAAEAVAKASADKAAALNADAANAQQYAMVQQQPAPQKLESLSWRVHVATAARLPPDAVADTTGAGDSFIGSVMYGITTGLPPDRMLLLGAAVAACKCTALGARPGLPRREQLAAALLAPPA